MELIERDGFLASLQEQFENVSNYEGHCVLLYGEAGIGKTSLLRAFFRQKRTGCKVYHGTCDALFTPRPLAPLYDIALQLDTDLCQNRQQVADRGSLFSRFFHELGNQPGTSIVVFEDIHWADEATLDFIKFFARRITNISCLLILTYRDNEIHPQHPLRNVLGQLPPDSFTSLQLKPLSREAVEKMAEKKGYSGDDVYSISGGNPFYVNEILANYSTGVPNNIKDSILSVYNRQDEGIKRLWELLSVLPTGFEVNYLVKMEPSYSAAIENSLNSKILVLNEGIICFKHELYRRTIESSLSSLVKEALNKRILETFRETFEQNQEVERIIHHAKNANEYGQVLHYIPMAAKKAARLGAHIEASKLYLTAIELCAGGDEDQLTEFYESYAYECYLTNRVKEAIVYQGKVLDSWKAKNDTEKIGNCMRSLSRFWWYEGNRQQAESYGNQAVEILADQPSTTAKAMAFSNMAQLKMLSNQTDECLFWGEKAIAIAKELADDEILTHALNNVGTVLIGMPESRQKGRALLEQSLDIALKNSFHEHAARAYTNLGSSAMKIRDYKLAKRILDEGILYCEERDLGSWTSYMRSQKALLNLQTGQWQEAYQITESLIKNKDQTPIIRIGALTVAATIKMRRGEPGALPLLLEARTKAFETMELQRIIPVLVGLLEYEWLTGEQIIDQADIDRTISMATQMGTIYENSEFASWLLKVRQQIMPLNEIYEGFQPYDAKTAGKAAAFWEDLGCPYEQALALFEGDDGDKRKAISIIQTLGADVVYERVKRDMRTSGIKNIPRGIRKSTRANAAHLTEREVDVLQLLKQGMQNKEIASRLFISAKTVDHHISAILVKLDVNSRGKAVQEALQLEIIK